MNNVNRIPKVLIIDDTYNHRLRLRNFFESRGYEVVGEADNGIKGVDMFERFKPDLVTMDVNMPRMDGIEALHEITKIDASAKVIMVSAMGDPATVKLAKDYGALDFVIKPFASTELQQKIEYALKISFPDFFEHYSV